MPFILVPDDGVLEGVPTLHQTLTMAQEMAEHVAIKNPGTTVRVYASVSSVFVPPPNPVWNTEQYVPEMLK